MKPSRNSDRDRRWLLQSLSPFKIREQAAYLLDTERVGELRSLASARSSVEKKILESVFAIALGTGAGWWADRHFDTSPIWLIVGATIGFGAFVLRLYRLAVSLHASAGEPDSPDGDEPE